MRTIIAALLCLTMSRAEVLIRWDFNGLLADEDASTGTLAPSMGQGTLDVVGGITNSFGTVASGATSDRATDNSQLRLSRFPGQGTANKTAGVELRTSTEGFRNIRLVWDHYNSGTASRYWRIQFSADGQLWSDHLVFTNTTASSWLRARTVSLDSVAIANDNPRFGVRIVAEFEDTVTGLGEQAYLAVNPTSNYSSAGTWWIDWVAIEGDSIRGTPPPVALWNFNSLEADADSSTGEAPSVTAVGETSMSFGSVAGGATSDEADDNSMIRLGSFPPRQERNKTAGVEFRASTAGYTNLVLSWDQYNSGSASRYWRLQYSTNGTDFIDHRVVTNQVASRWILQNRLSFAGLPGVDNNPWFAFRLVSEFESTATGAGGEGYHPVNESASYSGAGTLWLDAVSLKGEALPPNSSPSLSVGVDELTIDEIKPLAIPFTFADREQSPEQLRVQVTSSDPALSVTLLDAAGTNRTVILTPSPGSSGIFTISFSVSDGLLEVNHELILHVSPPPPAEPPLLVVSLASSDLVLSWIIETAEFRLEESSTLDPFNWRAIQEEPVQSGKQRRVSRPLAAAARFYRLRQD